MNLSAPALKIIDSIHSVDAAFSMMAVERNNKDDIQLATYHGTASAHATYLAKIPKHKEQYMAMGLSSSQDRHASNYYGTWAVAVDFDNGLPPECNAGGPLAPTFCIETSLGRYHGIFVLDRFINAEDHGRFAKALAARLGGDMAFARRNQTVRVPGTPNQKRDNFMVVLREDLSSGKTYTARDVWEACDGDLYEIGVKLDLPVLNHTMPAKVATADPELLKTHARSAVMHLKGRGCNEDYGDWLKVLMNLVPLGSDGGLIAEEFSKGSGKYDAQGFDAKWKSLSKHNDGSVSTLFAMAQAQGWQNPGWSDAQSADAKAQPLTDREFGLLIARKLENEVVVFARANNRGRGVYVFKRLQDGQYLELNEFQKRQMIEEVGLQVLKGREEARTQLRRLGTNSGLDDIAVHAAEYLCPASETRFVSGYPYLPVQNCVLNLLTGLPVPARYRPVARTACDVSYDPGAKAPRFAAFLGEVMQGDQEMVNFLLRCLGYSLLGQPTREQVMFVLLGEKASNGKSTLLNAVLSVLGAYGARMATETLMEKSHVTDGATPGLAKLKGVRVAVLAETGKKHKLDTSVTKQVTGEESIYVRGLYSEGSDMVVEFCIFTSTNNMPFADSTDNGMWRRMLVIRFDQVFDEESKDPTLPAKLKAERAGILNMLLAGLADYLQGGLRVPRKVDQATEQKREDADAITAFLGACCHEDHMSGAYLKDLYEAYREWAKTMPKFLGLTKVEFSGRLAARYTKVDKKNLPYFKGVVLTAQVVTDDGEKR